MNILICNAGSTSLKLKLFRMPEEDVVLTSRMDRIGGDKEGSFLFEDRNKKIEKKQMIASYEEGLTLFLKAAGEKIIKSVDAVGFKTVLSKDHYGVHLIDDGVIKGMHEYMAVAPVHNTCYLEVIGVFKKLLPGIPLIGVFETEFHKDIPEAAYTYPVPLKWRDEMGVRRFGYHGASHSYVAGVIRDMFGEEYRAVSCHLGGSSSLAAIVNGKGVDTSFGLSLQTGVPQSNRCGDMDPFIIFYMMEEHGLSMKEVKDALERESGLKGISGISGDMRDLTEAAYAGDHDAALAIDIYTREIARYIGGYTAIMGGLDVIAFTAGTGENSPLVREKVCSYFGYMGLKLNETGEKYSTPTVISAPDSTVKVLVIPANEELVVARKAYALSLENLTL